MSSPTPAEATAGAASPSPNRALRPVLFAAASGIGASMIIERCFGFLSNLLAARWAGPSTFGAYTLVLTTATTVAGYAAAGIGATAMRFSGDYPHGTPGYRQLLRSLFILSLISAIAAGLLTFATAGPLATYLIHKPALTNVLRYAALSACLAVAMECARGVLIGQRLYRLMLVMSATLGIAMITFLPTAARTKRPGVMMLGQASAIACAIVVCLIVGRKDLLPGKVDRSDEGPHIRDVMRFGGVQF